MATPIDDDTLQRFYDGDLSPLEEHSVHAQLDADPDAQRRLAELGRLTELMREATEQLGQSVDSAALFAAIESKLAEPDKLGFGPRLRVVAAEWAEHKRATLAPIAAAVAVAAASLIAVVKSNGPAAPEAFRHAEHRAGPVAAEPLAAVHGSRVENVDFGSSTGTVFEIDNQGVAVAVVWITDDEEAP